jgi:ABC-type xylose transport system substrate-binding protein
VGLVGRVAANALAAKLLPEKIAKRVAPPPAAFSVIDGEDYVGVWKHIKRATRATAALAVAVLARAVI